MNATPPPPPRADAKFLVATASLLLLIIALLAGLWLSAHRRATSAEREIHRLRQQGDAQALFREAIEKKRFFLAVDRRGLRSSTVGLDGRAVRALRLPSEVGESLGFRAGDVILIDPAPATATAPATPTGGAEGN